MRQLTVGPNDGGQRLDKFLAKALPALPQALAYKFIRTKYIKLNGARVQPQTKLTEGDVLSFWISDEFFEPVDEHNAFLHITPKLDVVYEDEQILLVNKPAGISVHSDENGEKDTLLAHIQAYLYRKGEYRPQEEQSFAPALCNRIDRNTCGLVIAAKTAEALRVMNEKIRLRQVEKQYLCLLHGCPKPAQGTLTLFQRKDEKTRTVQVFDHPVSGGLTAQTEYRVLKTHNGISLTEVRLITGRTHQIRAGFAHIGCPLVGEGKYGHGEKDRKQGYPYQALCAYKLTFSFPADEEAGALAYLAGKSFQLPPCWFERGEFQRRG
ncbi:MAG: RluA family pseudouridine synthase [Clostridia bacterium]|nr:RluA family pseudouridine synthase [Clostridia bacterium]